MVREEEGIGNEGERGEGIWEEERGYICASTNMRNEVVRG
jgi:hypothetical protein